MAVADSWWRCNRFHNHGLASNKRPAFSGPRPHTGWRAECVFLSPGKRSIADGYVNKIGSSTSPKTGPARPSLSATLQKGEPLLTRTLLRPTYL